MKKDPKIGVVGAGLSGLVAAYELQLKGYNDVSVFEKESRVGGKVETVEIDGQAIEIGAVVSMPRYDKISGLANTFDVELAKYPSVLKVKQDSSKFAYKGWIGTDLKGAFEGIGTFLSFMGQNQESIAQPGLHRLGLNDEKIWMPLKEFAEAQGFDSIMPPFKAILVATGYGYLDEVPAAYLLKLIQKMYPVGLRGILTTPFTRDKHLAGLESAPKGLGELTSKMAQHLNVYLEEEVLNLDRLYESNGETKIQLTTTRRHETFDKVVLAVSPFNAAKILGPEFIVTDALQRFTSYRYRVSVIKTPHLEKLEAVMLEENMNSSRSGHVVFYTNNNSDTNLFTFYQLGRWRQTDRDFKAKLKDDLEKLNVKNYSIVYSKDWNYFPHSKDQAPHQIIFENQGENGLYLTGSYLDFEIMESSVGYSQFLIKEFF